MGTRSKWNGLWKNDDKHYMCSQAIDVESIKEFSSAGKVRILVKQNKDYRKGTNRPQYCFAFADNYGASTNEISSRELQYNDRISQAELKELFQVLFEDYDGDLTDLIEELTDERLYTSEEVRRCIHGAARDGSRGYDGYDLLIQDYI